MDLFKEEVPFLPMVGGQGWAVNEGGLPLPSKTSKISFREFKMTIFLQPGDAKMLDTIEAT